MLKGYSQTSNFPFPHVEHLTTEQGLSNNSVYAMLEDKKGFLWFTTGYGLNRYDGYTFKSFTYDVLDKNSITAGWIFNIVQDKHENIWLGSSSSGIYSFNTATENFFHYQHENGNNNSLASDYINGLAIDSSGLIWISTQNGLDLFDPSTKMFKHFVHQANDSISISSNYIQYMKMDEDGNLWLLYKSPGVDCFNIHTRKVTQHLNFLTGANKAAHINGINMADNGSLLMGIEEGGYLRYNTKTKITEYSVNNSLPDFLSKQSPYPIFEDHDKNLWIGSKVDGLDYYDHLLNKYFPFTSLGRNSDEVGIVNDIQYDRSGNLWLVTDQTGLFVVDKKYKKIFSFQHHTDQPNSLSDNFVSDFFRDRQNRLFICTYGLKIFDSASGTFTEFKILEHGKNILKDALTWNCYEDSKGIIWFCTTIGLVSYNPITQSHRRYSHDENDTTSLGAGSCTGIIEDSKGRYWVTAWPDGGLASFNPVTGKFRTFKVHEGNNSLSTNSLGGLFIDSHGLIYPGCWNGGVIIFDPDNEKFKIFRHDAADSNSLRGDIVFDYEEAKSGIIWLCTLGGGINAFDPRTGKFRAFTTKDGLASDAVASLVEDNNKNYWVGTLGGISCFTPPQNPFAPDCKIHFRNYNTSDGLPANVMQVRSAFKDNDGKLYFGTKEKGFFYFNPDELKDNDYIPPVYITDFKLFNESVSMNDSSHILSTCIEETSEIKLSYKQDVISFTFSALNFVHPEKNQYAYMLEGFDKNWIHTDATKRFANYTNLDPGEYVFKVKASNNDGTWNEKGTFIKLIITPPYWQTWWFKLAIIAGLAGILYSIYRYRLRQVLALQMIRNNIAADLHDDIGSTLNSISIYSEVAKHEAGKTIPSLDLIGTSARKIVESMSDIVWTINPENDSFEKVIVRMRSFSYQLMKAKKIEFLFNADDNLNKLILPMQVRKNFYLIFKEAINNLVKYSEATRCSITLKAEHNIINLTIQDNGKGFNMLSIDDKLTENSSGNGLINMRRRAEEIKAKLKIESSPGNGTIIELILLT